MSLFRVDTSVDSVSVSQTADVGDYRCGPLLAAKILVCVKHLFLCLQNLICNFI